MVVKYNNYNKISTNCDDMNDYFKKKLIINK